MSAQHWGEYTAENVHVEALRPDEIKQLTKLQQAIIVEGPKLFQPPDSHQDADGTWPATFQMDPLVLATIQLERQNTAISQAISQATTVEESALMPLASTECFSKLDDSFNIFPETKYRELARGGGTAVPEIPDELCRHLLVRSVAALAAHAGFHVCTDVVLGVLADAAGDFLRSLCTMLRRTRDTEAERGPHGFVDAVERTFVDSGVGSIRHLLSDYNSGVLERLRTARDTNYQLRAEYDQAASHRHSGDNITLDHSLLVDILAETPAAISSVGPGGTIDMSAYPNMSFESADDQPGMNSSLDSEEVIVQSSPAIEPSAVSPPNKRLRP